MQSPNNESAEGKKQSTQLSSLYNYSITSETESEPCCFPANTDKETTVARFKKRQIASDPSAHFNSSHRFLCQAAD